MLLFIDAQFLEQSNPEAQANDFNEQARSTETSLGTFARTSFLIFFEVFS